MSEKAPCPLGMGADTIRYSFWAELGGVVNCYRIEQPLRGYPGGRRAFRLDSGGWVEAPELLEPLTASVDAAVLEALWASRSN